MLRAPPNSGEADVVSEDKAAEGETTAEEMIEAVGIAVGVISGSEVFVLTGWLSTGHATSRPQGS